MRRAFSALFLLIVTLAASGRAESEMPFRLANGFILVQARLEGRPQPLTMLLDSGASATVFDLRSARKCGLEFGAKETVQGVGSQAAAFHLHPVALQAAGHMLDHAVLAVDLSNAEPLCGEPVDGLIGYGFFAQRVVQIDYAARKLRFPSTAPAGPAATRMPLRQMNGVFCTQVSVNGSRPRWTRVDTGCNDHLHWVVPRRDEKRTRNTTIGFMDEDRDVTQAAVRLGDRDLPAIETSLHARSLFPGEAGLLGNALLSRYLVTFDGPRQLLILQE